MRAPYYLEFYGIDMSLCIIRARGDESPLHSRGKSWKGQHNNNNNDQSRLPWADSQESTNHISRRYVRGENEDVLQGYVVVDKNIIENNQFADGNVSIYISTFLFPFLNKQQEQ